LVEPSTSSKFSYLVGKEGKVRLEVHALIHELGVVVISLWLPFRNLTVDQIIDLDNDFIEEKQGSVALDGHEAVKDKSIYDFIREDLVTTLSEKVNPPLRSRSRSETISGSTVFVLTGGWDSFADAVNAAPMGIYGVLTGERNWRYEIASMVPQELDKARVSTSVEEGWFVSMSRGLMLVTKGKLRRLAGKLGAHDISTILAVDATAMTGLTEFLLVMDELGHIYSDMVKRKLDDVYRAYVALGSSMKSDDVKEIDRLLLEVKDAMMEERNILFTASDPGRTFVERSKEEWGINAEYAALKEDLDNMRDLVHAWYQERQASDSAVLGVLFSSFNVLLVMSLTWDIATRFWPPLVGFLATVVVGAVTAIIIIYVIKRYEVLETQSHHAGNRRARTSKGHTEGDAEGTRQVPAEESPESRSS
jgi:hypothetical protein